MKKAKECASGKLCHESKFTAYRHMGDLLEKESGTSVALLTVYRCKECGCWHVGHMPRTVRVKLGLLKIPLSRDEARLNDLATSMFQELTRIRRLMPVEAAVAINGEAFLAAVLDFYCKQNQKLTRIRPRLEAGLSSRLAILEKKAS
jgi:hypothetical protein